MVEHPVSVAHLVVALRRGGRARTGRLSVALFFGHALLFFQRRRPGWFR